MPKVIVRGWITLVGLICIAAAAVTWTVTQQTRLGREPEALAAGDRDQWAFLTSSWTPDSDEQRTGPIFIDRGILASGGLSLTRESMDSPREPESLSELRAAIESRGRGALARRRTELESLKSPKQQLASAIRLNYEIGMLSTYEGRFDDAAESLEKALELALSAAVPSRVRTDLTALLGIVALRRGEIANCIECLGPSSCIFPIASEAVYQERAHSRQAIKRFTAYLQELPGDLRIRWLLNLACMTLGEYPDGVPPEFRIPLDAFQSKIDVGRFQNVAPFVGLTSRGPNLAGGSVFDDFTGDGLPDLLTTSLDVDRGASLFVNRGNGTFEDRSADAGLNDQIYALNVSRADFDNDGNLDVLLLRGAWEKPMRLSLLQNKGNGKFVDVTVASGLAKPIATEAAAWGDFDNDGLVDLFVCGEYLSPYASAATTNPDPRNRCRLYHNLGTGKFEDIAAAVGVTNEQCAKGVAWGDFDRDGRLDLFVSNRSGPSRLYHNEGDHFVDMAPRLDVQGAPAGFACWFWDYDNDGQLDLFVNDFSTTVAEIAAVAAGVRIDRPCRPCLYHNLGPGGFRDVTYAVGLNRAFAPMGCNFGDIDNDGYLDIYFGTGEMSLEGLMPNLMFKNVAGQIFEDVTWSSRTGHLQKGHGVSFADWNCDGDLDLFVEAGGAVPGDKSYNVLFQNPGHGRHWLKVKLIGVTTNRAAIGAGIRAAVKSPDGGTRSIYRTVGNNSSFGGNSLVEHIGLLDATSVAELEVSWPTSRSTQTFHDIAADQAIEITEGANSIKPLPHKPLPVPRRQIR